MENIRNLFLQKKEEKNHSSLKTNVDCVTEIPASILCLSLPSEKNPGQHTFLFLQGFLLITSATWRNLDKGL